MKQSALVIATLFAAVEANRNHDDARARMQRDIHGYIKNGAKFDAKTYEAVHENAIRQTRIENQFKEEARENLKNGHLVMDEYVHAMKYEKSQETYTAPSAANGQWGNIHYNNPQEIMDNYVEAVENDRELGNEWKADFELYAERMHKSHEKMGNQINRAWNKNGKKAMEFADSAVNNAQEMHRNQHSLAGVDSMEVREDAHKYVESVVDAEEAVRNTIRWEQKMDQAPDRVIDHANHKYIKEKLQINKGYAKAIEFEIKNTHFNAGKPGGFGKLDWSHKQEIVDKWAKPVAAEDRAKAEWWAKVSKAKEEKWRIHNMAKAEAQKVWPKKFEAVQNSWQELAENFDQQHSLVSKAEIKASVTDVYNKETELGESVAGDFITYHNNTVDQRKEWKRDVETYAAERKVINQQFADAYQYEMKNFKVTETNGRIDVDVSNKKEIIDKWATAETNSIHSNMELKEDFINYQNSISADKAAFKATAKAQWPKKFEAFKDSLKKFDATVGGPQMRQNMQKPQALITDGEQRLAEKVRGQIYENMNERYEFDYEVKKDLKSYMENTAGARDTLKKDAAEWKQARMRVNDMYAAAWNYQVAETKFTPATDAAPAHLELNNSVKVSNNWRAAAQADEDLQHRQQQDVKDYMVDIKPAQGILKNEINTQWVPQAERINKSDVQIFEEVANYHHPKMHAAAEHVHQAMHNHTDDIRRPAMTHPYAHLMSVESSSSFTLNEQLAYGSVFLMAMVAVAALSNKGKAEAKSVEFDVEDLEMTNKKESKKQIKNTLKQIMKTSNTKVTLMNN